jgi:uncharacterized coiled-coil protein SlyX
MGTSIDLAVTNIHARTWLIRSLTRRNLFLTMLLFVCFALSPKVQATDLGSVLPGQNTADGSGVLVSLTTGVWNTGIGFQALNHDTSGNQNTAEGYRALFNNTTGRYNTANGILALFTNTTGTQNTANGSFALSTNGDGFDNTANGFYALKSNLNGANNTANGAFALFSNTTGNLNTANGFQALSSNTTGSQNTADGDHALENNTTGAGNIALGLYAGFNLTTGNNNIDIFNVGAAGESGTIRIGASGSHTKAFIAGISGAAVSGSAVMVDSGTGQLGVAPSSQRFKEKIKPMDKASEVILALKPVTFHYKAEIDPKGIPQFGLVAEEVEKVNPDLVTRDAKGKVYTVRYEVVNAMLLNEFLKAHRKMEEQEATIAQLKSTVAKQETTVAQQQKEIETLTTGLQKVSAQVEMNRLAPEMALNNP